MFETAETIRGIAPLMPSRNPWIHQVEPTLAMHDIVQSYLDGKGLSYCVNLYHFMNDIERG